VAQEELDRLVEQMVATLYSLLLLQVVAEQVAHNLMQEVLADLVVARVGLIQP
jgi:hypothetical protein